MLKPNVPTVLRKSGTLSVGVAPASDPAGQEVDVALILVDAGPEGMAGPAFPAHIATMGHWSMAVWERWLPQRHLQLAIASAKARLVQAARPW